MDYDVAIVGGSFAGLSAAIMLGRGRRKVCIIDSGKPRNRFAEASHYFFGQDGLPPLELIARGREKVLAYPTVTHRQGEVTGIECRSADSFVVSIKDQPGITARRIILATGVRDELPTIPGLEDRWGRTVVHCPYCHGYEFGAGPFGVLYVSPMSSHQALMLPDWGPTTYFLNGHPAPDADTLRKLALRGVTIEPARMTALEGAAPELTGGRLETGRLIPIAALFTASSPKVHPLALQLGCTVEEGPMGQQIKVDEMRLTSIPGVFAAGDHSRLPQNATLASADGVIAGTSAHRSLMFDSL